jgi:hypothetical protein
MSGAQEKTAVQEWMEREERWAKEREEKNKPKVATREEWMLVPPTSGVLSNGEHDTIRRWIRADRPSRPPA